MSRPARDLLRALRPARSLPALLTACVALGAAGHQAAIAGQLSAATTTNSAQFTTTSGSSSNPFVQALYVDPYTWAAAVGKSSKSSTTAAAASQLAKIPQAKWVGPSDPVSTVDAYVGGATSAGKLPVLVAYAIPNRDCGGYSTGGLTTASDYHSWVANTLVAGIAGRTVVVVVEPDALAGGDCGGGSSALSTRLGELADAVDQLTASPLTSVYLDAGNEQWLTPSVAASRLVSAHVAKARGFSINVSNFYSTSSETTYGKQVVSALASSGVASHFVIDTSRNGAGPAPSGTLSWCNPWKRLLGSSPGRSATTGPLDGLVWVKHPGESDGDCGRGNPSSGQWFDSWANDIVARSKAYYSGT